MHSGLLWADIEIDESENYGIEVAKWQMANGKRNYVKIMSLYNFIVVMFAICHLPKGEKGPKPSPLDAAIAAAEAAAARDDASDAGGSIGLGEAESESSSTDIVERDEDVADALAGGVANARDEARRRHYLVTWPPTTDPTRVRPSFAPDAKERFTKELSLSCEDVLGSPPHRYLTVMERTKKGRPHGHTAYQHSKFHRWKRIAEKMRARGYWINFRETDTYPRATQYLTECSEKKGVADLDPAPLVSPGHPPLRGSRRTTDATPPANEAEDDEQAAKRKLRPIVPEEFYEICVDQHLRTRADVMRYSEVDRRLVRFVMRYGAKLDEFLALAQELMRRGEPPPPKPGRIEHLREAATGPCVCDGRWAPHANFILERQGLSGEFERAMFTALADGRGKGRNLWLYGETNRGKTFLTAPIEMVYDTFDNPGEGKYNLDELPGKDVALLDDFRVEEKLIPWRVLLLWLDGRPFRIPRPRNEPGMKDYRYSGTAPVLLMSKEAPMKRKFGMEDRVESDQLRERLCSLYFHFRIDRPPGADIVPCGRCWALLILSARLWSVCVCAGPASRRSCFFLSVVRVFVFVVGVRFSGAGAFSSALLSCLRCVRFAFFSADLSARKGTKKTQARVMLTLLALNHRSGGQVRSHGAYVLYVCGLVLNSCFVQCHTDCDFVVGIRSLCTLRTVAHRHRLRIGISFLHRGLWHGFVRDAQITVSGRRGRTMIAL